MSAVEILMEYRWILMEAVALKEQADRVVMIGTPRGVVGQALTGMPGGTNDAIAASIQKSDAYVEQLMFKRTRLLEICDQFEETLDKLPENRDRVICRMYYANGKTDEQIAEEIHMETSSVNKIRNAAIKALM